MRRNVNTMLKHSLRLNSSKKFLERVGKIKISYQLSGVRFQLSVRTKS